MPQEKRNEPLIRTLARKTLKRKQKLDEGEIKKIIKLYWKNGFSITLIHDKFPHVARMTVWRAAKSIKPTNRARAKNKRKS